MQLTARKLIRLFGGVTTEDIENEARAISKLCSPGTSRYIVQVKKHGWLPRDKSCYFIDMELCSKSLEQEILDKRSAKHFAIEDWRDPYDGVTMLKWMLNVAKAVACGLAHLHTQGAVHRDLKPRNGT